MERTDQPGQQPSPREVHHVNGLAFRVITASSYTARMARDVRQLPMADGTVWTVGSPIGWHDVAAAWQAPVQLTAASR
ncbi:hypothetical protein [Streptomyces dubilierae]|uniref:Uncharacterized protein n=1 Tax=Streptomyces dubilierae TaxID=3075533 RepID=A0ABU2P6R8_9ACTN|nr:hypothetical protein [Streptomyces sp. DSM 41921]MDT0387842.1 hypothetical protein [Streptomyces sp. DSM 41921]